MKSGFKFGAWGLGFMYVWGLRFKVYFGLGLRVYGSLFSLGLGISGSDFVSF